VILIVKCLNQMIESDDLPQRVVGSIRESIKVKERLLGNVEALATIVHVSEILIKAMRSGNKLVCFGNGGSAADAQHIVAEFVGRFAFDRPALPALALSVNTSCVTAVGNDYGFDRVFSRQVEALGNSGDVAIGISTSGNSPNVLRALSVGKKMGLHTVAFTGYSGGELKGVVDHCICAPSNETPRIQECHILIGHVIAQIVEQTIFREQSTIFAS
jgi:D-sedoheptulose 7-phosphate isomerase